MKLIYGFGEASFARKKDMSAEFWEQLQQLVNECLAFLEYDLLNQDEMVMRSLAKRLNDLAMDIVDYNRLQHFR